MTGGFRVGDVVTIGSGRKHWIVQSFATWQGAQFASLIPVQGYSGTSVPVERLRAVA